VIHATKKEANTPWLDALDQMFKTKRNAEI